MADVKRMWEYDNTAVNQYKQNSTS